MQRNQVEEQRRKNRRPAVQHQAIQPPTLPAKAQRVRRYYDYSLLFAVVLISIIGLLMIYSSSQYTAAMEHGGEAYFYAKRQAMYGGIGLGFALIFSFADYHLLLKARMILVRLGYVVAVLLLVWTMVRGVASHGATRWISIAGVQFQPTEFAKGVLIVFLAAMISKLGFSVNRRDNIFRLIAYAALPTLLVMKENLSSGIILAGITFVILFVACRNWKWFVGLGAFGLTAVLAAKPLATLLITRFNLGRPESYQLRRVFGWAMPERFPDDAFQTLQGLYAIGSGGFTGQGLGESIQKFGKLPEAQNDMIFSIICEELGLIGAIAIILLFVFIFYLLVQIAFEAPDLFGSLLCVGVLAHLSIQVILNIAVVTGVIPNTGVTLPFISYGGSAIVCTMVEIGIVLSVARRIRRG